MGLINTIAFGGYIIWEDERVDSKGKPYTLYILTNNSTSVPERIWARAKGQLAKIIKSYYNVGDAILVSGYLTELPLERDKFFNLLEITYVHHKALTATFTITVEEVDELKKKFLKDNEDVFGENLDMFKKYMKKEQKEG